MLVYNAYSYGQIFYFDGEYFALFIFFHVRVEVLCILCVRLGVCVERTGGTRRRLVINDIEWALFICRHSVQRRPQFLHSFYSLCTNIALLAIRHAAGLVHTCFFVVVRKLLGVGTVNRGNTCTMGEYNDHANIIWMRIPFNHIGAKVRGPIDGCVRNNLADGRHSPLLNSGDAVIVSDGTYLRWRANSNE